MYGILFNIIIVCVWNSVYNISNFVVIVVGYWVRPGPPMIDGPSPSY